MYRLRRRPEEGPGSRCGAAAGVRLAADDGARDRTPAHRAPLRLWDHHLRHRAAGRERAGAVWAADHCDHPLPVCGPVLVEKRTAAALAELFATPVSEGTVATRAANGLAEFLTQVGDRIAACEVAGFDETGLRVAGRLHWVHCARTGKYTLITCHPKRGREGLDAAGVLDRLRGVAVHDAWAPYDSYLDVQHQLCCAHAQRELQAVTDTAGPDVDWCWAIQANDALATMQKLVADAIATGADTVDPDALDTQIRLYRSAVQIGVTSTTARSDKVMRKHNALARRLLDRQDDYLRFTRDWRIPADNNGSERDIRMIKLRQKVSGCLRTLTGATQFCAIRSYLSTAAKHGKHFLEVLVMLAQGRPWLPAYQ